MTTTNRAYSALEIKSVNTEKRIIRGIATTPRTDRMGDIVEPLGVTFKNPMPLLWQHKHDAPVGTVRFDPPTEKGITFEAELPVIAEEGTLRNRIEEAWQSIQHGLVRAVSIGFRAIEYAFMDEGDGVHFLKSEVYELSLVTVPANADAVITAKAFGHEAVQIIKKFDTGAPATTGTEVRPSKTPHGDAKSESPAAPGRKVYVARLHDPARDRAKKPFVIRKIYPVAKG